MVDVKEAVKQALEYFTGLYQGSYSNLALEEVELSDDEDYWLITLGFTPPTTGLGALAGANIRREYKIFRIKSETGKVLSMKIRIIND